MTVEKIGVERIVQAPVLIDEGVHKGIVIGVEPRTDPYKYLDVVIEFDEGKRIKAGYADYLSTVSKLGLLLARFGVDVSTPGTIIKPDKELIGKKCQFMTLNKAKDGKTYANVVPESVKPCK